MQHSPLDRLGYGNLALVTVEHVERQLDAAIGQAFRLQPVIGVLVANHQHVDGRCRTSGSGVNGDGVQAQREVAKRV
ncbi:hypothetical protein D3C81_2105860 [compost metagenome]